MRYGAWASVRMAKFRLTGDETILCLKKKRPVLFACGTRVLSEPEPPFLWLTVLFNDSLDLPVGQLNGPCVHLGSRRCYLCTLVVGVRSAQTMQFFHTLFPGDSRNKVLNSGTGELVLHETQPAWRARICSQSPPTVRKRRALITGLV
jgi:hypothetical protein